MKTYVTYLHQQINMQEQVSQKEMWRWSRVDLEAPFNWTERHLGDLKGAYISATSVKVFP